MIALIGLSVLCVTGCSSTRSVTAHESVKATTNFTNYTNSTDSVLVAEKDSVTITKTITITKNEQGDTIRMSTATDRGRVRNRDAIATQKTTLEVRTDTVFVQKTDSVFVERSLDCARDDSGGRTSPFTRAVKWLVALVVVLCVLIALVKFRVWRKV